MTNILLEKGLILNGQFQNISGLVIYPPEYFSPKSFETEEINLTSNTYTIHHYAGSWIPWYLKWEKKIWNLWHLPNKRISSRLVSKVKKIVHKMIK
jgi:hypothetical protein